MLVDYTHNSMDNWVKTMLVDYTQFNGQLGGWTGSVAVLEIVFFKFVVNLNFDFYKKPTGLLFLNQNENRKTQFKQSG